MPTDLSSLSIAAPEDLTDEEKRQLALAQGALSPVSDLASSAAMPSKLTSVGSGENEYDLTSGNGTDGESQMIQPVDRPGYIESDLPPPPHKGAQVEKVNSDGSTKWSNGVTYYPGRGIQWEMGPRTFIKTSSGAKTISFNTPSASTNPDVVMARSAATKGILRTDFPTGGEGDKAYKDAAKSALGGTGTLHDSLIKQLIDRKIAPYDENNKMLSPQQAIQKVTEYDKNAGVLTPQQQHEVDKVTQQANSSRAMYARQYITMQPNYMSVVDNVTNKPADKRDGVDDAFLISAAAGLENPGRATTGHDFALLMKTVGIRGNLEVLGERLYNAIKTGDDASFRGTRVLSDAQVRQILDNSTRAIKPRYDEYLAGQKPFKSRLEKIGVDPDTYLPNLELPAVPPTTGTVQAPVAPQPTKPALKVGEIYPNAKGQKGKYLGGDPNDPNSYQLVQ